ncbi:hypothetical protein L596_006066 [Steinernema carpocapsae]|uniref:Uncharacterized protein n=1 Tax=Steinernema carpocapsae TaxID=34508 RepID=A0A4U8V128_STECR|nr:hypothetical protein L596_006066 [Steinernema carpocapsae]
MCLRPHADEDACKTHAPHKTHTRLWARIATVVAHAFRCVWLKTHVSEIRRISMMLAWQDACVSNYGGL